MSDFIKNTMAPYVQRKGGVSNVSSSGLVEKLVQVQLNQDKVDAINAQMGAHRQPAGRTPAPSWRDAERPRSRPAAQNTTGR